MNRKKTLLMGILNTTPDSFYANSRAFSKEMAIERALQIEQEGADWLDIGGESSRPGATIVALEEELLRVIPVIRDLKDRLSIPISIDTYKPAVAKAAVEAGAKLINDITGFNNPEMVNLAIESKVDLCLMHMQGTPQTMQKNPFYEEGIVPYLLSWFKKKTDELIALGISQERIIIDPGIGFGKTVDDNLKIIQNLPELRGLGFRVLLGVSRKSFLSKILSKPTEELLPATLAINIMAIASHVDIIRVHDVKEHRSAIDVMAYMKKAEDRE